MTTRQGAIRVLIVDDHAAVRQGLTAMLDAEHDLEPVAAASTAREALELLENANADIALLDYNLPDQDGLSLSLHISQISRDAPRVVIYSAFADDTLTVLAVIAGASAVVSKAAPPETLCEITRMVAERGAMPAPLHPRALEEVSSRLETGDLPILGMLLHRTPPAEIANTLGVSESWLATRRWEMLEELRGRRGRGRPARRPAA